VKTIKQLYNESIKAQRISVLHSQDQRNIACKSDHQNLKLVLWKRWVGGWC